MPAFPLPPPPTCPIAWQPHALAPVFFGRRDVGPDQGAPVRFALFFPSLDGAVATAPLLTGCGHYPLVVLAHGHCNPSDTDHYKRWFHLPAQLARSGYVVAVPELAGIDGGENPSDPNHSDLATLASLVSWMRLNWEHAGVLSEGPIGMIGHSWGAQLAGRFATTAEVGAFASLGGVWGSFQGPTPNPLTQMHSATLLIWGGPLENVGRPTAVPDAVWNALPAPKHRVIWAEGEHWDYLVGPRPPCDSGQGPCAALGVATSDLVTLFLGKYLSPELAVHLIDAIPNDLTVPDFALTPEQEFFAGGHLAGLAMLEGQAGCDLEKQADPWPLLANRRSRETHSRTAPCAWVRLIAPANRRFVLERPAGYSWCDFCFPDMADG